MIKQRKATISISTYSNNYNDEEVCPRGLDPFYVLLTFLMGQNFLDIQ